MISKFIRIGNASVQPGLVEAVTLNYTKHLVVLHLQSGFVIEAASYVPAEAETVLAKVQGQLNDAIDRANGSV